jgi:hypothetical protein
MTPFPYLVLDQNVLRNAEAIAKVRDECCRNGCWLLLPDGAFFEMSVAANPLDTWTRSLEHLKELPELVCVSCKMMDLVASEKVMRQPVEDIVNREATAFLRSLLTAMRTGGSDLQAILHGPAANQLKAGKAAWSNSEFHKQMFVKMRDLFKETLTVSQLKRMRANPRKELETWVSSTEGTRFVFQWLQWQGLDEVTSIHLATQPSITAAFATSIAGVAIYWLAFDGLNGVDSAKVTNDMHDVEYVAFASLCRELVSCDRRANTIHRAVRAGMESRSKWLQNAKMFGPTAASASDPYCRSAM